MASFVALTNSLGRARQSEQFVDLTIECKGREFYVHRVIVCAQSRVFTAMVNGEWMESVTDRIILENEDPEIVAKMIDFFYTATYEDFSPAGLDRSAVSDDGSITVPEAENDAANLRDIGAPLVFHAKLYILGDKYDIPALRAHAVAGYADMLPHLFLTESFVKGVRLIYDNIPAENDRFKDMIFKALLKNIEIFSKSPRMLNMFRGMGDLTTDLLVAIVEKEKAANEPTIFCPSCNDHCIACECQEWGGHGRGMGAAGHRNFFDFAPWKFN